MLCLIGISTNLTNGKVTYFDNTLNELYRKHCPIKIKYISVKRLHKPWITNEILEQIRLKSCFFKLYRRGLISKNENNYHKNRCHTIIRQAKRNYFHSYFNNYKSNMKKYWAGIKCLIGKGNKRKGNTIDSLVIDNCEIVDEREIAAAFNNHFSEIAHNLEGKLPPADDISPTSLIPLQHNSFYFFPVTPGECIGIIMKLKESNYGRDKLSTKILKLICEMISEPLCSLVNESVNLGIFPDDLKLACITPIYKKGDPTNVSNYRPISVLPLLSKIFEKAMANRMSKYLSKFSLITPSQFGFQKDRGTCDAICTLTDYIYEKMNEKEHSVAVFLDLAKAYDTVNHSILLSKLHQYGF